MKRKMEIDQQNQIRNRARIGIRSKRWLGRDYFAWIQLSIGIAAMIAAIVSINSDKPNMWALVIWGFLAGFNLYVWISNKLINHLFDLVDDAMAQSIRSMKLVRKATRLLHGESLEDIEEEEKTIYFDVGKQKSYSERHRL